MKTDATKAIALDRIVRYMITHGWKHVDHPNKRINIYSTQPNAEGDFCTVSLPAFLQSSDTVNLVHEALQSIADFKNLSLEKAEDAIERWDRDIFRARLISLTKDENSLPLAVAADTIGRLKEFMGYAAYTQSHPEPFFDKAGGEAAAFSEHCQFGHTFRGSFGLVVECPISVIPELSVPGGAPLYPPEPPFERRVIERVANGFSILRSAIEADSIDPMLKGFKKGFSANMCHTLSEIFEKADGRRVEYDISWSPEMESPMQHIWKPFLYEGRANEFTRVAAAALEKVDTIPESIIEGQIIVLKSDIPPGQDELAEFEHLITMYWERQKGQTVQVRVPLSPQDYKLACDAHKEGRIVQIFGVPEKKGKFWTLTKPRDFTVFEK